MKKSMMVRVEVKIHDKLKEIKKKTGATYSFIINKALELFKESKWSK